MSITGPLERILQTQLTESENKIIFLSQLVKHLETQMAIAKDIIKENKSSISNYKKKYQFLKSQVDDINESLDNQNVYSISTSVLSDKKQLERKIDKTMDLLLDNDTKNDDEVSTEDECSPILTPYPSKEFKCPSNPHKTKKRRKVSYEEDE